MPRNDRRQHHLRVPVTTEENEVIKRQADLAGVPIAAFLRDLGLGYTPPSVVEQDKLDALIKAMGDLGRLGGLLKLWLTDDPKLAAVPPDQRRLIPEALQQILEKQAALRDIIDGLRNAGQDRTQAHG